MMFKFYLTPRSVNEATSYYLSLIERAIQSIGSHSERIFSIHKIQKGDIVITIESKDFFVAQLLKPKNKKINWFQGINPEEAMMVYQNSIRKIVWELFEWITLKKSALNLFVSTAMQQHYFSKYGYHKSNYLIIPCYNALLNPDAFYTSEKYSTPNFVYAGSLSKWQCIDQVLAIFKHLQSVLPNAKLNIITAEQEKAKIMIKRLGLRNVQVMYVPIDKIGETLKNYKYGFLIRENHIINAVATPIKMSTYLAYGVIPIFSDVVSAFNANIDLGEYKLSMPAKCKTEDIAQYILDYESSRIIDPTKLLNKCQQIFNGYYNDQYHIQQLGKTLQGVLDK